MVLQQLVKIMIQCNTSNSLLNIDFSVKKGLILNWNFKGQLSKDNFYRHLIILDVKDRQLSQTFLRLYYKKIKFGDLLAVYKTKKDRICKNLKWKEKNFIDCPNFDKIFSTGLQLHQLNQNLIQIANLIEMDQGQEPLILSILTDKVLPQRLKQSILRIRNQKQKFNFIVNIFGKFKNSINFGQGINFFQFTPNTYEHVLQFYKNYTNRIQLYFVQISIECQNGSICCQKSSQWPNTGFNRITKRFYAPHMEYETDILFFLNSQNYGELDVLFHITLEYETLEGRKFKSSKRMSLKSFDKQIQSRTLGMGAMFHELQMHKNVWFQKYPFKSEYFVWFKRNIDKSINQCSSIQDSQF